MSTEEAKKEDKKDESKDEGKIEVADDDDVGEGKTGGGGGAMARKRKKVTLKVGMVGDAAIGKTSLMVKYVEGSFTDDYVQTLGVVPMEKMVQLKNVDITFNIWDLGGQHEFLHMLPLVCNEAVALLFMFDLSRKSTLSSVRTWYKQVRVLNKEAQAFLVGTKYDFFSSNFTMEQKKEITESAIKYAAAMKAPLVFCSSAASINVKNLFQLVLCKVANVACKVPTNSTPGDPVIVYD